MRTEALLDDDTTHSPLHDLWTTFRRDHSIAARDRLVLHHAPLVKYVAGRLAAGLPPSVDDADLVGAGVFGLIDAIERYDPGRGVKFETYAVPRIRGAILDELRAMDWVPRSIRAEARSIGGAREELIARLGREPTDEELAGHMGVSRGELGRSVALISRSLVLSLDGPRGFPGDDDGPVISDGIAGDEADPSAAFDDPSLLLPEAIAALPEREARIVTLYYYEGLTLAEIGEVLGVSESRVCQVLGRSIGRLRRTVTERLDAEALA